MTNKEIGAEQELYLAPEEIKIKNADEIAEVSLEADKYPFIIGYDPNEKDVLLAELTNVGCTIDRQMDFANCVAVSMSMTQLKAIKTLSCVEIVESDYDYKILSNYAQPGVYETFLAGEDPNNVSRREIKLALFDTGVSKESKILVRETVSFIDNTDAFCDPNGHGTQMAGIIASVGTDSENQKAVQRLCSVTVANHRGFAKTSTVMTAIDWAINNEIKVICMCFGTYFRSSLLEKMINRAVNSGIVMVAAAGNDGGFKDEKRIMYPAAFSNVLSVGAKSGETVASYSSGGTSVDCLAPGTQNSVNVDALPQTVIGTSASAAYVAGKALKIWCSEPESEADKIKTDIKSAPTLQPVSVETVTDASESTFVLTEDRESDRLSIGDEFAGITSLDTPETALTLNGGTALLCDDGEAGCSPNDMSTAFQLPVLNWMSGCINCPGSEVWYKFTANAERAHPNRSPGWYTVYTQGSLDTIGYLYDAYGNLIAYNDDGGRDLNFNLCAQANYNETYYIRVKAYGNNIGNFDVRVSYIDDDHGNTPETATEIIGVYYEDKSVTGYLHSQNDVDYYTFVPARNCVMEIYTEGSTDTYGELYCASGGLLLADNDSNGNGNFKITAHLEALKRYYIAVKHNSSTGYGDYTLKFKFKKDYMKKPDLGSSATLNYENLRTYINWVPDQEVFFSRSKEDSVGVIPLYETGCYIGRSWMNWSTAEHWNLHVLDNTEENAEDVLETLKNYALETIVEETLKAVLCAACALLAKHATAVGFVLGGVVAIFSSAIHSDPTDPEVINFREMARSITNDNSKWIMAQSINYTDTMFHSSTPAYLQGTNETTYEMDNNMFFYGEIATRGTFVEEFAKQQ